MAGESKATWRQFIDDLDARGLARPEFVIVDGAPGLEAALVALWGTELPIQRCTVHTLLSEEFLCPVKTQTVLPCAETVSMLFWILMASGPIFMQRVDGRETIAGPFAEATLNQAA